MSTQLSIRETVTQGLCAVTDCGFWFGNSGNEYRRRYQERLHLRWVDTTAGGTGTPYAVGSNYTLLADITLMRVESNQHYLHDHIYRKYQYRWGRAHAHSGVGFGHARDK